MKSMIRAKVSVGTFFAVMALCALLSGTAYAAPASQGTDLAAGSVHAQADATAANNRVAFRTQTVRTNVRAYVGQVFADGKYVLAAGSDVTKLVGIKGRSKADGGNVILQDGNNASQIWRFKYDHYSKTYIIVNDRTGKKVLTVKGKAKDGDNVYQQTIKSQRDLRQRWIIKSTPYGYQIISAYNKHVCLAVRGNTARNNSNVVVRDITRDDPQCNFWISESKGWTRGDVLRAGYYTLSVQDDDGSEFLLGAKNESRKKETLMTVSSDRSALNQVFEITPVRNGYYSIVDVNSSLALSGTSHGAVQRPFKGYTSKNQVWKPVVVSGGGVSFVSRGGWALDLRGSTAVDEAMAVVAKPRMGKQTQTWTVSPATTGMSSPCRRGLLKANARGSKTNYFIAVDMTAFQLNIYKRENAKSSWEPFKQWSIACGQHKGTNAYDHKIWNKSLYYGDHKGYRAWYWSWIGGSGAFHSQICYAGTSTISDARTWGYISGGCIRMTIANAKYIYQNIPIGTFVSRFY